MLETDFDPNLILEANSGNFDQNLNLDEYFPSTADANSCSILPYLDNLNSFDSFQQVADDPTLRGNGEKDLLLGSNDNNQLYGLAGDDLLVGDRGNDTLTGSTGKDILVGGEGNDLLVDDYDGGDLMTGDEDADIFSIGNWGKTENPNNITDFTVGTDQIKVGRLGATFKNLTIQDSNEGAIVSDGEHQIAILQGVKAENLQPDSFIFGDPALAEQLQSDLNQGQTEGGTPGATQAIVTPDGFIWQGAAGVSNLETQTPTQTDDIFNIASITKSFVGATVLKLTESGTLSLDDTLGQWLPDVAANIPDGEDITLRQLLNGTSGISDLSEDPKFIADVRPDVLSGSTRKFEPEELVAYVYGDPRFTGDDPNWAYPETGHIISKLIVEKATGTSFTEVLREQILEPLGLNSTFVSGQEQVVGNQVRGYDDYLQADGSLGRDGVLDDVTSFNPSITAGDLFSNAQDVTRFYTALFSGELLQANSQEELLNFVDVERGSERTGWGLGVETSEDSFGTYYARFGDLPGYESEAYYYPDRGGATVSTLVNRRELLGDQLSPEDDYSSSLSPILEASLNTLQKSQADS
ncbi:MAG: hypothetical protein RLZZ535_726 [Cyanobacteriota bacterium]|jgi:D-alanyl-D-alanine carboxypeptidase